MISDGQGIRLQKVLAEAGVGSRRMCEDLIDQGRVTVNGKVVQVQGMRVDPELSEIRVDGDLIKNDTEKVVYAFHKPTGVLTTMHDEMHRPSVGDYLSDFDNRLFHVGRLDADTDGLLLLTNDGKLANQLTHPSFGVSKTYLVRIPGPIPKDMGKQLKTGIALEDGLVRFDSFSVIDSTKADVLVEVVIHEGRHRIVRRSFEELGHPVKALTRVAIGPILLGDLKPGQKRRLNANEYRLLRTAAGMVD